ncbi:unnamed protein product [Effrenium voratum]|nr:unnamed protein product [Effrenium voratum]
MAVSFLGGVSFHSKLRRALDCCIHRGPWRCLLLCQRAMSIHCPQGFASLPMSQRMCFAQDHSTNGSFLNGNRLPDKNKRYRIRSGDKLTLKSPDIEPDYGWKVDFGNTVAYFSRA